MNYSQALESLIQEIVYYGDSAERREKVHCSTLKTVEWILTKPYYGLNNFY